MGILHTSAELAFKPSAGLKSCFQKQCDKHNRASLGHTDIHHEETSLQVLSESCNFLLRYLFLEIETLRVFCLSVLLLFMVPFIMISYRFQRFPVAMGNAHQFISNFTHSTAA